MSPKWNTLFSNEKVICIDLGELIEQGTQEFIIEDKKHEIQILNSVEAEIIERKSRARNPRIVAFFQDKRGLYTFSLKYDGDKTKADLESVVQLLKGVINPEIKDEDRDKNILWDYFKRIMDLIEKLKKEPIQFEDLIELEEWIGAEEIENIKMDLLNKEKELEFFEDLIELEEWIGADEVEKIRTDLFLKQESLIFEDLIELEEWIGADEVEKIRADLFLI